MALYTPQENLALEQAAILYTHVFDNFRSRRKKYSFGIDDWISPTGLLEAYYTLVGGDRSRTEEGLKKRWRKVFDKLSQRRKVEIWNRWRDDRIVVGGAVVVHGVVGMRGL